MFAPAEVVFLLFLLVVACVLTISAIVTAIDIMKERRQHGKATASPRETREPIRASAPVPVTRRARLDAAVRAGAAIAPVPLRPGDAGVDGAPRAFTGSGSAAEGVSRDVVVGRDQVRAERAARLKVLQGGRR